MPIARPTNMYMLAVLYTALLVLPAPAQQDQHAVWQELDRDVLTRLKSLEDIIDKAHRQGLVTDYARASAHVIRTFRVAAASDRNHLESIRAKALRWRHADQADTDSWADNLPYQQLRDCLLVADHAIEQINRQLSGEIVLAQPPDLMAGNLELGPGYYRIDGRVVFPSSLTWLPAEKDLMQTFGTMGDGYLAPAMLTSETKLSHDQLKAMTERARRNAGLNAAPLVYLTGHLAADWMKDQHPEIAGGARRFTQYDIDNPLIRGWLTKLYAQALPDLIAAGGDQPVIHLLANEPHFSIRSGGWLSRNGLSDLTISKFRQWVETKYVSIDAMNTLYGTSHNDFSELDIALPLDTQLRGTAIWYDWCRFNMDRVNEWFSFLKEQAQRHDGHGHPVSIKLLGHALETSYYGDGGIDVEYLTGLQDVLGADLRVTPYDALLLGDHEEGHDPQTTWKNRYAYDWMSQSMFLDFSKSLRPNATFFDSEWHGFSAVSWRHYELTREYTRSALWAAFSHGMGVIKPWLWGRDLAGRISDQANPVGELSTQPIAADAFARTMKELNAHADLVADSVPTDRQFMIYFTSESSVQSEKYIHDVKVIYESLKLQNFSVGFTTPNHLASVDPNRQVLITPGAEFISDKSIKGIKNFAMAGGITVQMDSAGRFTKDELGVTRPIVDLPPADYDLSMGEVLELTERYGKTLGAIRYPTPLHVTATTSDGRPAYGTLIQQWTDIDSGKPHLLINNTCRENVTIEVNTPYGQPVPLVDILTQQLMQNPIQLESCEVRLLRAGP